TDCLGFSAPIQRWQVRKPGTRCRSGMCSVSYQSLNSSSATFEKSIAAIKTPFAMATSSDYAGEMLRRESRTLQLSGRGAGDRRHNQLGGLPGVRPAHDLDPLALFQILVVAEEVGDLSAQDRRQVPIRADGAVERCSASTGTARIFSSGPCSSSMIRAPTGRQRTTAPGTIDAGPTNNTPESLSSSYLTGSPPCGISTTTLMSFGGARPTGTFAKSMAGALLRRHALLDQLAPGVFVLLEIEAHRAQHMRRLGELNVGVFDHLDPIAPGVEKVEEGPRQQLAPRGLDTLADARTIVDDEPEMPAPVFVRV